MIFKVLKPTIARTLSIISERSDFVFIISRACFKQGAIFVVAIVLARMAIQQKKQQTKVCCSLKFGESAGALILSCYAQIIKELCAFVNLHSHDTHCAYFELQ